MIIEDTQTASPFTGIPIELPETLNQPAIIEKTSPPVTVEKSEQEALEELPSKDPRRFIDSALYVTRKLMTVPGNATPMHTFYYANGGQEMLWSLANPAKRNEAIDAILSAQIISSSLHGQIADTILSTVDLQEYPSQVTNPNSILNQTIRMRYNADKEARAAIAALRRIGGPQIANFTLKNAETVNITPNTMHATGDVASSGIRPTAV